MNKKLIAIAVASVMAAPVAMADIKVSGRVGLHFTVASDDAAADDSTGWNDNGQSRVQFDGTVGNAYARIAYDGRGNTGISKTRDNYLGYKFGGGMSVQAGRMATAGKNIEKDPYIASFLQIRSTPAESATAKQYGSSSFVDHLVQLSMKAGAAKIKVQYDAGDQSGNSTNEGHIAIAVTGKAGAVNYWAAYNNATADGNNAPAATNSPSNIKLGGAMKFGKVKVSLNYTSQDKDAAAAGSLTATDSILVMADMGFGNGLSGNVAFATRSGDVASDDATWMRLAVTKKLSKGVKVYGGYTTTDNDTANTDTSEFGVGMLVKF